MKVILIGMLLFSIGLPAGLLLWWKKKSGEKIWCFLAGAVCFFLFANVLEALLHQYCLGGSGEVSAVILASPVLYTLYGSFAAGIFEETGRLFGFRILLKNHSGNCCSVAYGIGHGGMEVLLLLGSTYAVYLLVSLGIPVGGPETTARIAAVAESVSVGGALLAALERISAMMTHIGLSMIMFAAVKRNKFWLYPVSICIHALVDVPACLYQFQILRSLATVEILAFVMGAGCLLLGKRILDGTENPAV